jgi:UDP-N-acetylglucosamine 2-epimerase (non-hydrolysing)
MACSIAAKKLGIRVAHVEAGIRSFDISMPEEINRMVTDSITDYFFTTTARADDNLLKSGVEKSRIYRVGNTMIDTLLKNRPKFMQPAVWKQRGLKDKEYVLMTMHRPANVDGQAKLKTFLERIIESTGDLPIVFPIHPRTAQIFEKIGISHPRLHLIDPLPYLEFNYLTERAKVVITDSGGITEETTVMGVPCMTLRDNTERPETCEIGTNELLGTDPDAILPAMDKLLSGQWKKGEIPELWDGMTATRIVKVLEAL